VPAAARATIVVTSRARIFSSLSLPRLRADGHVRSVEASTPPGG
jgi:hypothetical protein